MSFPRGAAALCTLATAFAAVLITRPEISRPIVASAQQAGPASTEGKEQQARATCAGCHAFPPPDILPRAAWRDEFVRMMYFRENRLPPSVPASRFNRTLQLPPDMEQALPYFTSRAPEHLPAPESWPPTSESPVQFARSGLSVPDMPATPAVANIQLVDVDGDKRLDVLGTDMRQGLVFIGQPAQSAKG